ncbi:hypothetical protein COCC4DRAFT_135055 [Bipolaris maydis ATCC 48331]|uniref:MYND-type domain-containing protein n=2 Tax=Cochliobolus heterostrophus TaxID=5016 RepID=M2TIJ8_COCH5|nr:uncharacterized protein COCC4DRAFT_135055 [Bipolaris maydis ATCC 48331]EMD86324.1 hypothetical protein COCHEDRAFT_1116297 [Bipolaris maydis C5]KAJ5030008.1 hypothetical protein J3E73DRAFT_181975 [Bipolaris maydis]ENI06271.1 hypothetical protein COCC4DRAFT_135055 [Bipolaris maydis ATCC 48331]KAJ5065011.1 hypothetical protein J3E74DRAFT_203397 [Bipolaris maydis]KAJ6200225.1 hypothetical protein J3E72DRAFT_183358 [Bipolaris maydis]
MSLKYIPLTDFRLPDYPDAPLILDGAPLSIIDTESLASEITSNKNITIPPAIGIATLLYNWHPNALAAFLDLDAWFSFTWTVSIEPSTPSGSKLEIGRIGNQITFGQLDASGENWAMMLTYNIKKQRPKKGTWIPNPKESMLGPRDITSAALIPRLASSLLTRLLAQRRWETGKRIKHHLSVEYAPMDIWGDGIPMSPHWLYKPLDLTTCTTCGAADAALQRCGKCGTATYCSDACQKRDWKVHKGVCTMGLEDRGQAIRLAEKGGLIAWDEERMFAREGSGEGSRNPYFEGCVGKRVRAVVK